jgi:hypothetical protein
MHQAFQAATQAMAAAVSLVHPIAGPACRVLQGGRNSGQNAQKGPGKKSWPKEFVAEVWPNFTKVAEKGPKKIF